MVFALGDGGFERGLGVIATTEVVFKPPEPGFKILNRVHCPFIGLLSHTAIKSLMASDNPGCT